MGLLQDLSILTPQHRLESITSQYPWILTFPGMTMRSRKWVLPKPLINPNGPRQQRSPSRHSTAHEKTLTYQAVEKPCPTSPRRRPGSRRPCGIWVPASTGMTDRAFDELFQQPPESNGQTWNLAFRGFPRAPNAPAAEGRQPFVCRSTTPTSATTASSGISRLRFFEP